MVRILCTRSFEFPMNVTCILGETHLVTAFAHNLFEMAESKLREKETEIWELEKQINPLLDENDKVRFQTI